MKLTKNAKIIFNYCLVFETNGPTQKYVFLSQSGLNTTCNINRVKYT